LLRHRWLALLLGIGALAFALRAGHLFALRDSPFFTVLVGDGRQYDAWAQRIAAGDWIGRDVFYQSPLYPYFLAVIFKLSGHHLFIVRLLQAAMGACSCVLLGFAARRFVGPAAALAAAGLLAIYPPAIFFDGLIQKASLDLLLITGTLALLAEFMVRRDWKWIAGAGLALGLLALNRENARVLYFVVAGWLLFGFRDVVFRGRLKWALAFTVAVACVLVPVGLRNYQVGGEFLLSTSQFGPNFYVGNHTGASGSYEPLLSGRGDAEYERRDAVRLAEQAAGRPLSASEVSSYWWRRTVADIRTEPLSWLRLVGRKLFMTMNAAEVVDTESLEAHRESSPVLRVFQWLTFGVVLPLAVLGAWVTRADWRRLVLLHMTIVTLMFSVAAFYVLARYRFPVVPVLLILSGAGLAALVRSPARLIQSPGGWVGLVLAGGVAVIVNLPVSGDAADSTWFNVGSEFIDAGRPADAVPLLERAIAEAPGHADAHFHLGVALSNSGDMERAAQEFDAAVRLQPDHAPALAASAAALVSLGRNAESVERARRASTLAPANVTVRTTLATALWREGRQSEALVEYNEAARLTPDDPLVQNNLGTALQLLGRHEEAIPHYERALTGKPGYVEAMSNLALAYASTGRASLAAERFRQALGLAPENFGIRVNYGDLLIATGHVEDGIEQYRQALSRVPASPDAAIDVLDRLARAYAKAGKWTPAIDSLQQARVLANAAGLVDRATAFDRLIAEWRTREK